MVYATVGVAALSVIFGSRTRALSFTEALSDVSGKVTGRVLIIGIAFGLLCFALWRLAQGLFDADRLGSDLKGILRRSVYAFSSVAYLGSAAVAIRIGIYGGSPGSPHGLAARALSWPMGSFFLALVGAGSIGVALGAGLKACRSPSEKPLNVNSQASSWMLPIGRAGNSARGFVYLIIGYFLVVTAYSGDIREVRDMGGALNALLSQPYGVYLYLAVALGLLAFGIFEFIEGIFRRVELQIERQP
jgi:hypothetical protein